MWTTIKLKQDCCRIVFKQLAVRNRRLLSLWQVFTHPKKYKIVNWNIVGKSVRVSQACPDFPLEAMPSFAINNHIFNLVQGLCTGNTAKGPAAQLRYMSTNQKCELKKSIYMSNSVRFKVQFGAKCAKTCTWFHEITSFDRFDSTSSPLWDCDLGSSRMAADHYEGINLSAALQAQHLKVSRARVIPKRCIFVGGFNSRSSYRPNKLLILNM